MSPPLCKDCRHLERTLGGDRCYRAAKADRDLVTGKVRNRHVLDARLEREGLCFFSFGCGPKGRYFEPKKATRQDKIEQAALRPARPKR